MKATAGTAETPAAEFMEASRTFLTQDFLPKLVHCLENMSDDQIWWRPNEQSNSAGNLVLHLRGNIKQWIASSLGGVPFRRDRDSEFISRDRVPKADLITAIQQAVAEVDSVLAGFPANQLLVRYLVQIYRVSALQAVYHVVEHFSYHLGQILYIYKLQTAMDPGFYDDLNRR
jgi:uncharacterized damage-inducible protein DinB